MSFGLYSMGFAILIGGLIYGAHLMHMPARWFVVGAVVLRAQWEKMTAAKKNE